MTIAADFVAFVASFVPFLILVVIALVVFAIAIKVIPSLNEWMNNTDGMGETDFQRETRIAQSRNFDQYV